MGRLRFLISRRWILFFLAVVIISWATWWLGQWQFGRLSDRKDSNAIVRANEQQTPTPVDNVLGKGPKVDKESEWLLVTATGIYDPAQTITWRYRSNDRTDEAGIDVVVPLVTADGTALFIDRGFVANDGNDALTTIPDPPSGTVTVEGYVRANGTGDATKVYGGLNTRSLSSATASQATGLPAYGGWLQLKSESPAPADAPDKAGLPDLSNGPHFFYGIQWWFFGFLAIVGFGYLLWDEYRLQDSDEADPDRERDQDGDDGDGHSSSEGTVSDDVAGHGTPSHRTANHGTPSHNTAPAEAQSALNDSINDPAIATQNDPANGSAPRTTPVKTAKEQARDARVSKKKALKAAYQAAYAKEKSGNSPRN